MKNRIFTIPNLLSVCRLLFIPVFIWAYCVKKEYYLAFGILVLSGITDIVDGYIARHFHMTTDLGKALDPIADKITQAVVLLCLAGQYPFMLWLACLLIFKEVVSGLMCLFAIRKTKEVKSADWHGKLTTCLIYLTMVMHILWVEIPMWVSVVMVGVCILVMVLSFSLYFKRNVTMLRTSDE